MTQTLSQTPMHAWHAEHGGRLVEFSGWSMPVIYSSIVEEHLATRNAAGLFDISHMGRLRFDGAGAAEFIDSIVTRRVTNLKPGQIRYGLVTNAEGGILDDVLVYQLPDHMLMVVNAGNREKIIAWLQQHLSKHDDVEMTDQTFDTAMIALQGPHALALLQPLVETDLATMKYYTGVEGRIASAQGIISRTGYTGEDGAELIVPTEQAVGIWEQLVEVGATPCGLGARDTLRLEAAMPLYGHELNEQVTPVQAGLDFAVNLKGRNFIGCEALDAQLACLDTLPKRIGLQMEGKRVPREHFTVWDSDVQVGEVTSGTYSPTLDCPIAMAYVEPQSAEPGKALQIDIRGKRLPAEVVPLPFYSRH